MPACYVRFPSCTETLAQLCKYYEQRITNRITLQYYKPLPWNVVDGGEDEGGDEEVALPDLGLERVADGAVALERD